MSETDAIETLPQPEGAPADPRSYLQIAARLLRLADASDAAETKLRYVLLASVYQRLSQLSENDAYRRSSTDRPL